MENEIHISIVDRKIKVGRHVPATMTNIGKDYLSISLDDEWSSTDHKLRVTLYSEAPYVSVQDWWDGKSAIEIPQEITLCPAFKITVAQVSKDGYERLVTQAMDEPIENPRNGHDEGTEPGTRTMDIIARIDALAADLEEKRDTDYWRGEPGKDGAPGAPGEPGADGYSPTASVTKNGGTATITVTDKNGTTTAIVSDGAPGKDGSDATATDVRINGTSITADGVADIPTASFALYGAAKYNNNYGIGDAGEWTGVKNNNGVPLLIRANAAEINAHVGKYRAIVPENMDYAVKAAMCDGKGASWTADEQSAARERMNAADANKVYIMQKQIANLQGIVATEETDSTEAYTKAVPAGAQKWASLDKVGGKTVVNDGELVSAEVVEVESKGTFPITQSVREMCPGYGWSAGTVYNEIDFERKVYVQKVGSVDLGTLDWRYVSSLFSAKFNIKPASTLDARKDGLICDKYQADKQISISFDSMADKTMLRYSDGTLFVKDEAYTDSVSFKADMAGVQLYYELATPIEVDLSNVLPDDHYIEVEAGGTVTFKQASTQLPVPSSVTYQISTSEVIANA